MRYHSRKKIYTAEFSMKQMGSFPYDVKYLSSKEVWEQVSFSKQFWLSDLAMLRLKTFKMPKALIEKLKPLHSHDGTMRFFEDEFWHEVETCLGIVTMNKWKTVLRQVATEGFLKQDTPQWTPERAKAHLQDDDIVAKRASVHADYWQLYIKYKNAGKPMTEAQLKRWIEIKRIEAGLEIQPWFITRHIHKNKKVIQKLWFDELRKSGMDVEQAQKSHFELFEEAKKDLR